MIRIALIGAGNVASHLAEALEAAGHRITEVFSLRRKNAALLAERLYEAVPISKPDLSHSGADLVILSVSDAALPELLPQLRLPPDAVVVHTSGTLPMSLLAVLNRPHGVFYPLQTFSKDKAVDLRQVPFCLEASDPDTLDWLVSLASDLSTQVYALSSEERRHIHLAAVIACNFANHLWHIASKILESTGTSLQILQPLLQETLTKALQMPPKKAQTGPAVRGDMSVINRHTEMLERRSHLWAEIYRLMSQSIAEACANED